MTLKSPTFILELSNAQALSKDGSVIVLEVADDASAMSIARKIAEQTGRHVTVRDADMIAIETIGPPSRH